MVVGSVGSGILGPRKQNEGGIAGTTTRIYKEKLCGKVSLERKGSQCVLV